MKISILDYLEETAAKFPHKIAIEDSEMKLTFSELINIAKRGGSFLINQYEGYRNRPIAVEIDRSAKSIVLFFSTLYSGNFYVPIDNQTPIERLNGMFSVLNPLCALNINDDSNVFSKTEATEHSYSELSVYPINENLLEERRKTIIDVDPCYVLFTSGSTGVPKGVTINHKMVIDLSNWLCKRFDFTSEDIIGNQTPFYFDASVKDIYIMVRSGATLNIIQKTLFTSPLRLVEYLNEKKITTILWATSAINLLANSNIFSQAVPKFLQRVFFAGEALHSKQLNTWRKYIPQAKYINLYGPTEATVDSIYYIVNRDFKEDEAIPIGNACENMEVFLVDEENNVSTEGIGEIVIRGTGVAMGYYGDTEKSNSVFIQDPRQSAYRDIVYKTGDLGRYNSYGEIVFVSRADNQVKHLGYRIELGEIELALNSHSSVEQGISIYDDKKSEIVYIYSGKELTRKDIFFYLKEKLPKYMFPTKVVKLDTLPLNQNGKINRKLLKEEYLHEKI